jgi:hypothetical protein
VNVRVPSRLAIKPARQDPPPAPAQDPELVGERDRLIERMTIMQSELGGLFYEMAIRDHVRMEVLIARAAELQDVHGELTEVEGRLRDARAQSNARADAPAFPQQDGGQCPACSASYLAGAAYCSQCAHAL